MSSIVSIESIGPLKPQELGSKSIAWGDLLELEDYVLSYSSVVEQPVIVEIAEEQPVIVNTYQHQYAAPRWCKQGNACVWKNCKFRHERCEHYDKWVASKGKTRGCRCQNTDSDNCKNPEEGGCKYDHRDLSTLKEYIEQIEIKDETTLLEYFMPLDLECKSSDHYDISKLSKTDKGLLLRSLEASSINHHLQFVDFGNVIRIEFN